MTFFLILYNRHGKISSSLIYKLFLLLKSLSLSLYQLRIPQSLLLHPFFSPFIHRSFISSSLFSSLLLPFLLFRSSFLFLHNISNFFLLPHLLPSSILLFYLHCLLMLLSKDSSFLKIVISRAFHLTWFVKSCLFLTILLFILPFFLLLFFIHSFDIH